MIKKISTLITLDEIIEEAPDTLTFKFTAPENIKWTPGSYAHFLSSDLNDGKEMSKKLVRELSIMTHPDEKQLGFTTRIRQNPSEFKQIMSSLNIGDEIRVFKFGNHFKTQNTDQPIVLISMGVGIATFRPIIKEYLANASQASFITNINIDRSGNFVYKEEFEKLPTNKIKNCLVTNRNDLYTNIDECLSNTENVYYIVGSSEFNQSVGDYLLEKNVNKKAIIFDKH